VFLLGILIIAKRMAEKVWIDCMRQRDPGNNPFSVSSTIGRDLFHRQRLKYRATS
jgi:hypothetical protein